MKEQIYINGELMDQTDGAPASLVYQSPFFTDIDSIVSNRSNSVDFPVTRNNLRAIDNCHLYGKESVYAYRKHRLLYFRDGIQLFAGYGTLLSITSKAIRFSFTWGSIDSFQKLLDTRLQDLVGPVTHIWWNRAAFSASPYMSKELSFQCNMTHPFLPVSQVLSALQEASGVTFGARLSIFNKYAIPLVTKKADTESKLRSALTIRNGSTVKLIDTGTYNKTRNCLIPNNDQDLDNMYMGDGIYDVSEVTMLNVRVKSGMSFSVYNPVSKNWSMWSTPGIMIMACTEDGLYTKEISRKSFKAGSRSGDYESYSLGSDIDISIDVSEYSYIIVALTDYPSAASSVAAVTNLNVTEFIMICDIDAERDVALGGYFPLYYNLPDWTGSQLLKNLMKLEGVFPAVNDNILDFVNIDVLYRNRENALDWTDRLMLSEGMVDEQTSSLSGFAQTNNCKYAEDDTLLRSHDWGFKIEDETLDKEVDLINLDFAATDYLSDFTSDKVTIAAYTLDDNGDMQFTEVQPRVLAFKNGYFTGLVNPALEFKSLDMLKVLMNKYKTYISIVSKPKILKTNILIDPIELAELDLAVPIYSYKLGHYYAISKLTTKSAYTAEVELLQLNPLDEIAESVSTIPDQITDLSVVENNGVYSATIPSLNSSAIGNMNSSGIYKVALIRYGYTRKGKNFTRYDKFKKKEVTTHTARDRTHKNYRGKLCWRVIGQDIFSKGSISTGSKAYKFYIGNGANTTLVFNLGAAIKLPPLGKVRVTKAGRIGQEAHMGKTELFIGLYKKAENGWTLCSNRVQVRGRNSDKTHIWDFDTENLVY